MQFPQFENQEFLIVGIAKNLCLQPQSFEACYVDLYKLMDDGSLELVHRTQVEHLPMAFHPFRNNILIGLGPVMRYYEIGKKKLLRKAENREFQGGVIKIQSLNERIFVTDVSNSLHVFKFIQKDGYFIETADDILPRWISSTAILDY